MICCGSNCCASCALFSRCTSCQTSGCRIFCLVRPGHFVCPWAAARPRDRHTRACGSEWSISKPGQALPPPTGTAASPPPIPPAPSTSVGLWWLTLLGASSRSPSRPRRRPRAPQQALPIFPYSPHRWRWDFTELGAGCRRAGVLMMQNSRLVAVKPRLEAVWRSKCRPPR